VITLAIAIALSVSGPPHASLTAGTATVPLAVSSWCWGTRCGAPIAASTRTAAVARRTLVRVDLAFIPTHEHVAVAGRTVAVSVHGRELSWPATRGGGLTINVTGKHGWVTYVGRIRLR
jgi:hypothetical protein